MSGEPQDRRRRGPAGIGVHPGGGGNIVGQESGSDGRLGIKVGHPTGGHRHMMVVEAVFRRKACRRLEMPLRVNVWSYGRDGGRGGPVLGVAQAEQLLDGEGRPLRHRLRGLVQDAGCRHVDGVL